MLYPNFTWKPYLTKICFLLSIWHLSFFVASAQHSDFADEALLNAQTYYEQKKFKEASKLFQQTVDSLQQKDVLRSVEVCKDIGAFYHNKRNHYEAFNYFYQGINMIAKPSKTKEGSFYIKHFAKEKTWGRAFKTDKDKDKAVQLIVQLYSRLGGVYFNLQDYSKAEKQWLLSLNLAKLNNYRKGIASAYNNLAEIKRLEKQYDSALLLYHKATAILEDLKDEFTLCIYYSNIALNYLELQQEDSARLFFDLSEQMAINEDTPYLKMSSSFSKGEYFWQQHQHQAAIGYFLKTIKYADELQDINFLYDSYQRLSNLYKQVSELDSALYYLNKWVALNEAVKALEIENKTLETEATFLYEEKERELQFLKEKSKIEQKNAALSNRIFYGLIFGLVLLLGALLLALHWRNGVNHKLKQHLRQIRQKNDEKDVLLKEIHHRVKNNLQVITGLLGLQSSYIDNDEVKKIFSQSQSRIKSMALIHEMLYQAGRISEIDYKDYLEQLIKHIVETQNNKRVVVDYIVEAPELYLNIDTAIPLGLIVNEMVTNSIKYAFAEKEEGKISVVINKSVNKKFDMTVEDDGIGYDHQRIRAENTKSLGLKLIYSLIKQLNGTVEKLDCSNGTKYRLEFEIIRN